MREAPHAHLTSDDLDALLAGAEHTSVRAHLAECPACNDLAANDRALVDALAALPHFDPTDGFAERVMAQVRVAESPRRSILRLPARVPALLRRPAAVAAFLLVVGTSASITWSLGNRDVLAAWGSQALALLDGWFWLGLRTLAANVMVQPWYAALRDALGSPSRLALAGVAFLAMYVVGLLVLRRLMALPSRPMPHAA
jgi:hypothetical protein